MEMNYMLGYGSAENSLRLLWKYGVLELLLPIQVRQFHWVEFLYSLYKFILLTGTECFGYFTRQLILFHKAFEDGIRGLTCYW